jgi:lysophospholipase L1-like esterase
MPRVENQKIIAKGGIELESGGTPAELDPITNKLRIAELPAPNAGGHYEQSFGDGTHSSFAILHELKTFTPAVTVVNQATGEEVWCNIRIVDENTILLSGTVWGTTPPGAAEYRVSVDASSGLVATNGSPITSLVSKSEVGANNGVIPADSAGLLPALRLPTLAVRGSTLLSDAALQGAIPIFNRADAYQMETFWSRRDTVRPVVLVQGHSIVAGTHAADPTHNWAFLFGNELRNRLSGTARTVPFFIPAVYQANFEGGNPPALSFTKSRAEILEGEDYGYGWNGVLLNHNGDNISITLPKGCTSLDVVYGHYLSGGTFKVIVNGTTVVSAQSCEAIEEKQVDGETVNATLDPRRENAIVIENNTGVNKVCPIGGICVWQGDEKTLDPIVINAGHGGLQTQGLFEGSTPESRANRRTSQLQASSSVGGSLRPSIVLIMLLVNDYSHEVASATTKANIEAYMHAVVQACPNGVTPSPQFVIVIENEPTAGSPPKNIEPWANFRKIAYEISAAKIYGGCAIIDLGLEMPTCVTSEGALNNPYGWQWDTTHPNNTGHRKIADMVTAALTAVLPRTAPVPAAPPASESGRWGRVTLASGNLGLTETKWANVSGEALDIKLTGVKPGQVVEVALSGFSPSVGTGLLLDAVSIVGGAPVNSWALDGTPTEAGLGVQGWRCVSSVNASLCGTVQRAVTAADLVNGELTLRLRYKNTSGTARTLDAEANAPLIVTARNLG